MKFSLHILIFWIKREREREGEKDEYQQKYGLHHRHTHTHIHTHKPKLMIRRKAKFSFIMVWNSLPLVLMDNFAKNTIKWMLKTHTLCVTLCWHIHCKNINIKLTHTQKKSTNPQRRRRKKLWVTKQIWFNNSIAIVFIEIQSACSVFHYIFRFFHV